MSNYRNQCASTGISSIPPHQSLCLCLLVYLWLLFWALSWIPDETRASTPCGGSYCKLSLHLQSFKTPPNRIFFPCILHRFLSFSIYMYPYIYLPAFAFSYLISLKKIRVMKVSQWLVLNQKCCFSSVFFYSFVSPSHTYSSPTFSDCSKWALSP